VTASPQAEPESAARIAALRAEHADLERQLADPALHADPTRARRLGRRYAELSPVVRTAGELASVTGDLAVAQDLSAQDSAFADEAAALAERVDELSAELAELLAPRDPDDAKDIIMEIKAGEGGEESALFAGDLLRMYLRYAEHRGWKTEILSAAESDLHGYTSVTVAIKAPGNPAPADGVWARLKFEGGVHRVQRVPVTESQGRIHTSAAGVFVAPEPDDTADTDILPADLRIDVFRSSGPGGQSVNTTDSAVRITHVPTGIVVSCQNEKSQLQNREQAMRILRSRLLVAAREAADAAAADVRRAQVRTVDRSERIRTYNFPENRIADHRVGYKAHNLDAVLAGSLDGVLDALAVADRAARIAGSDGPARSA
jgi:peptide chain release factor 1